MQLNQRDLTGLMQSLMFWRARAHMLDTQRVTSESRMSPRLFTLYRAISKLLVCAFILIPLLRSGDCSAACAFGLPISTRQENLGKRRSTVAIQGIIKDDHGGYLPKASIVFKQRKSIIKRVESNESGSFTIDLPAGIYSVLAKSEGCQDFYQKKLKVERHTPKLQITVKCSPTPIR